MEGKELALSGLGWVGAPCAHPPPGAISQKPSWQPCGWKHFPDVSVCEGVNAQLGPSTSTPWLRGPHPSLAPLQNSCLPTAPPSSWVLGAPWTFGLCTWMSTETASFWGVAMPSIPCSWTSHGQTPGR